MSKKSSDKHLCHMENINNRSGEEPLQTKNTEHTSRKLEEVTGEILEIIENTHWIETRLAKLKTSGFQIEHCWVKNGSIATVWYMSRKNVFRIQIADSEPIGNYHKAYCVIIPSNGITIQENDRIKIRNFNKISGKHESTATRKS